MPVGRDPDVSGTDLSLPIVVGAANLALKFLLELAALAAFAYWGAGTGEMPWSLLLAVVTPLAIAALWGTFAAPRSARRLPVQPRIRFELTVFTAAVLALLAAGVPTAAVVMSALVILNAVLLTVLGQWEA
jgi:hypothetical protein